MMPVITRREGAIWMNASGIEIAVVAKLKATRWASPVQVLTAATGPARSREKVTAAERVLKVSSPSRTANREASESNQFNRGHTMQINPPSGRNRMKARPGLGFASEEMKLTRIPAPTRARIAARVRAARRKLRPISEGRGRGLGYVLEETSSSRARTVAARPMEAMMIQSRSEERRVGKECR